MFTDAIDNAISEFSVYTHMCSMRRMMLYDLFEDIAAAASGFGDTICQKHSALVPGDYRYIKYKHHQYNIGLFNMDETIDLHPSMHEPMDQLLELVHSTVQSIGLVNNYIAAAFSKSPVYADIMALLPSHVAAVFEDVINKHDSPLAYTCWRTMTKYTDAEIAEFNRMHAATLKQFKILQLNQLTL